MELNRVLIDFIPSPVYRLYCWIKERPRHIKWWFQRANGKLPDCDWWDYKHTLVKSIQQGLENLLYNGNTDWDSDYHKEEKKDLEFVLEWAKEFESFESGFQVLNSEDCANCRMLFGDKIRLYSKQELDEFLQREKKAFELLGKHIHTLWD